MENKKIDLLFGLVVIAFLVVTFLLIKELNAQRGSDKQEFSATVTNIIRQKNNRIRLLSKQLAAELRVNEDLRNTLGEARNDLDSLSKKISQQAPVAVPAAAPAPAAVTK